MLENLRVLGGGSARAHLPRFFLLQMCATFPEFVVSFAEADHICRVFLLAFVVGFASVYGCALKCIIHVPHAPAARKAALTCSAAASVSASAITHPPPPPPVSFAPNAP